MQVLSNLDSEPRTRAAVFHQRQRKLRRDHAFGEAILFPSCSFSTRGLLALVGPIAGGAIALAAACAPAAPAVLAAEQDARAAFVPAPPAPMAAYANTELGKLLDSAPEFVVAGERLNVGLLRRFYARHGFEPVWTARPAQANSLMNAVLHAGDHGLAPELFHANLLLSPQHCRRLTGNCCCRTPSYPMPTRWPAGSCRSSADRDDEVLTPEPIDVAAALDAAIGSPDPAAAIEALAPTTPTYRLLRQALQNFHSGIPVGGKTATTRLREIEVNLERERWLPRRAAGGPRLGQRCRRAGGAVPRRSAGFLDKGHCRPR